MFEYGNLYWNNPKIWGIFGILSEFQETSEVQFLFHVIPFRKFLLWNIKNQNSDVFPSHFGISNKKFVELKLEGVTETQTILFKL